MREGLHCSYGDVVIAVERSPNLFDYELAQDSATSSSSKKQSFPSDQSDMAPSAANTTCTATKLDV